MKYLGKIIEYGLYLFVFFLPLQTRWIIKVGQLNNGPWEYGTISLYGTDILLVVIIALFIIYRFLGRRIKNYELRITNLIQNTKYKTQSLLMLGLILASAFSIFFAADKPLALYKFGWLILGLALFWLIISSEYDKIKLIWCLFAGLAGQSALAIWQFLFQTTWQSKWLGLALHRASELGTSVIETAAGDGERWLRAYGGLDHPNILGGLMAIGILLLVGEIMRAEKLNNFQFSIFNFQTIFNVKIFKILSWPLLVIFTAALFFSFSRSAWLGLAVGLIIILVGAIIKKDLPAQKILSQAILIIGILSFILFLKYPDLVMTRLYVVKSLVPAQSRLNKAPSRLEIKATSERIESIKNSWPIIKNHWLGGAGLGNYTLAIRDGLRPREQSYYYQPAHNMFILVLSEIGVFGLLFFLGLMISLIIINFPPFAKATADKQLSIFKQFSINKFSKPKLEIRNWKLSPHERDPADAGEIGKGDRTKDGMINLSILIALIVFMSLDHWFWSLHFGVMFLWLVLGLASRNA